jgi:3-oxoacyl-[acyl-carrier protein] reductase
VDLGLSGKVALVTGASSGIGRSTAAVLAREGAEVMITARRGPELEQAVAEMTAACGGRAEYVVADLRELSAPSLVVERTIEMFGGLDILVNNGAPAGMGGLFEWDEAEYGLAFEAKAFAYLRAARAAVPQMRARGGGVIVNVAGLAGRNAQSGYLLGTMSNKAIHGMNKALADELAGDGIRVVCIDPGAVGTDRFETAMRHAAGDRGISLEQAIDHMARNIPLGRVGTPEDLADVIAFVVSERASYITGSTVVVDGGLSRAVE